MEKPQQYQKSRAAQHNPHNIYLKTTYEKSEPEAIDDWDEPAEKTQFLVENAKTIVNKIDSPDVHLYYSLNPYQGCEHGCIYCYARNSHQYWGYSAGIDFEQKIIVKHNAPALFRQFLHKKGWKAQPISLSGNTDCYQPAERKFKITQQILQIALEHQQPMGIITKNSLILRDIDLLQEMAQQQLCCVYVSLTTLNEDLRRKMEPRTTTAQQRLHVIEQLAARNIPVGIMAAPIIPGLNSMEIPEILKTAANAGATQAGYTIVRLNGEIAGIFKKWLELTFPDKFEKVWHGIQNCHNGKVSDSNPKTRMQGIGLEADMIKQLFKLHVRKNNLNLEKIQLNSKRFAIPNGQLSLF